MGAIVGRSQQRTLREIKANAASRHEAAFASHA